MPTRVNGIGTTYIGKSNVQTRPGYCESCRNQYMMENYETGLWFTIIFIPVIPLGKKQILDYCPACSRHKAIPLQQWEQIKEDAVQEGIEKLSADTQDPQAAMELHATYEGTMQAEEAEKLAQVMLSTFSQNIDVLLYLAAWYEQTQRSQDSDACFQKALQLEPENPHALRGVGIGLLEQGRLEDAHQHLMKLAPPSEFYDPGVFAALAEGYQNEHRHNEALDILNMVLEHSPELQKDRAFRKMLKKSQKQVGR